MCWRLGRPLYGAVRLSFLALSTSLHAGALNVLAIRITSPFCRRVPIISFTSHRTRGIVLGTGAARHLCQSIRGPGILGDNESHRKQQNSDSYKDSLTHAFSPEVALRLQAAVLIGVAIFS